MQDSFVLFNPYKNRVMSPLPSGRPMSIALNSKAPLSSKRGLNVSVDLGDSTPKATRRERSVLNISANCDSERSILAGKFSITQFLDSMVTKIPSTATNQTESQMPVGSKSL
jgi:hypothetical protein